jgi:hypothetical protein
MGFTRTIICGEVAEEPKSFGGGDGKKEKLELRVYDGRLHHTVIVWEPEARPAKGDTIIAEGRIGYRSYEGKDGKVWVTEYTSQASGITIIGPGSGAEEPELDFG